MTEFEKNAPPTKRRPGTRPEGRRKWADFVAALRENPLQWAKLPYKGKSPLSAASMIRTGGGITNAYPDFTPREDFQVHYTMGEIWIRYAPADSLVRLEDNGLLVKFYELVQELTYEDERPYDVVEAEVDMLQIEIRLRFGDEALDRSAAWFTATKASGEDMIRIAREEPERIIAVMKNEG